MKTLIVGINSKYIHSALAPWYLKSVCGIECGEVTVREFTINDNIDSILASIFDERPDTVAFSCYIWNISFVIRLAGNLKKILPGLKIITGGPEVSYDSQSFLAENLQVDYVIAGEGEVPFKMLLKHLFDKSIHLEDSK